MHEIMNCVPSFQKTANMHKYGFLETGGSIFKSRGFSSIFNPFWLPPFTYKSSSGQKQRIAPYTTINNNASDQKKSNCLMMKLLTQQCLLHTNAPYFLNMKISPH